MLSSPVSWQGVASRNVSFRGTNRDPARNQSQNLLDTFSPLKQLASGLLAARLASEFSTAFVVGCTARVPYKQGCGLAVDWLYIQAHCMSVTITLFT